MEKKAAAWLLEKQMSQSAVWVRTKSGENPVEFAEMWQQAKQLKCPLCTAAAEPALEGHELYVTNQSHI